jgi:cyclase
MGAGELVINSIANDGVMGGYDYELLEQLRKNTRLPITILGGAGTLSEIEELISKFGIIGAGAGSLFVFKGKYRAVLINYPDRNEKDALIKRGMVRYEANTTKS